METNKPEPLVSVLMPCYNHEAYVAEAISSVLAQTYKNVELIVIDDGSTDGSWAEIEKVRARSDFRAIRRSNKGLIETLKELRALANGEYLTILASDDRFYPRKVEVMLNELRRNPAAGLCVARSDQIDERGEVLGITRGEYVGAGGLFEMLLNGVTYVSYVATLARTEAYRQVEFISDYIEDLPAWLQISRDWPVVAVDEVVGSHRQVSGSMSRNYRRMIFATQQIISHFSAGKRPFPPGWCVRWLDTYMTLSPREAVSFLWSRECSKRVLLTAYFYKVLLRSGWVSLKMLYRRAF
jgi:glycosyltransferase involved in cell wall biosynthesis